MKLKFDKYRPGVEADVVLSLEHSANVTPCFIEKENRLNKSCSSETSELKSNVVNGVKLPGHECELDHISK